MIALFVEADLEQYGNQCPPGWVRYTPLDGRFPKGAPAGVTSDFGEGGSNTHSHAYNQAPRHNHSIPQITASTNFTGSHSHNFPSSATASGEGLAYTGSGNRSGSLSTSLDGEHTHPMTVPASISGGAIKSEGGSAGEPSAVSTQEEAIPPFQEVIFCQKV